MNRATHYIGDFGFYIDVTCNSEQFGEIRDYCIKSLNGLDVDEIGLLHVALHEVEDGNLPPAHPYVKVVRDIEAGAPGQGTKVAISAIPNPSPETIEL